MPRPAQFTREDVLDRAMRAFHRHGFGGTGVAELVRITKLQPGSLYSAFQSKETLFLAVLDRYGRASVAQIERTLARTRSPLEGIRRYFRGLAREVAGGEDNRSCLLVNTVLELSRQNATVQRRVNQHLESIEAVFRRTLERARDAGELSRDADPAALAAFLMTSIWGLRVLSGTAPRAARAGAIVAQVLSVLR